MINTLSLKLARRIKANAPDHPRSEEVLKYAISFLINTFSIILFTILISLFTGRFIPALLVLIGFAVLRQASGGAHLKSGLLCIIFSTLALTAFTFMDFSKQSLLILNIMNLILTAALAPTSLHKPITRKQGFQLKLLSMLIVASNFILSSSALGTAFFAQGLTLIPRKKEMKK